MNKAYDQLPADAVWSCSFGYPGEGGFTEYHRQPDGTKWVITNGQWGDEWKCVRECVPGTFEVES
jgi:hypothetical protein